MILFILESLEHLRVLSFEIEIGYLQVRDILTAYSLLIVFKYSEIDRTEEIKSLLVLRCYILYCLGLNVPIHFCQELLGWGQLR